MGATCTDPAHSGDLDSRGPPSRAQRCDPLPLPCGPRIVRHLACPLDGRILSRQPPPSPAPGEVCPRRAGHVERSRHMVVRFRPSDEREVMLRCSEPGCSWSKMLWSDEVYDSLRGHYGLRHPERRLPDRRDAREAAGLV
ncbi:hypothetical protein SEA_JEFE_55 [Microbacterium phage Jefe]|uniref:Uncharacterized protein n=8 Tax=Caudoviricetes TaxID=2731619 RepID=A0A8F3E9V7_9CAUD|nr:hypothetical protein SEA_SCUMBERLAND_56 [Microbacterium phage Scumberland]QWY84836.1 hypothetical protein SEA_SELWYN23_56 [Microbacterium phage Selwyn23]WBF79203.1 hypothetical protein SEA_JEFE_55 [Microbacterium phage Jefe]WGH20644.1 hypothetical protein SEA_BRAZZALEPHS_54 [Microbacterium phage BrazzalePHS]